MHLLFYQFYYFNRFGFLAFYIGSRDHKMAQILKLVIATLFIGIVASEFIPFPGKISWHDY